MTVTARSIEKFQVEIKADSGHIYLADEPEAVGGDNTGPNPYNYLLGALASCKIITVQMYAQRKGWPVEEIEVNMSHKKIHASDCHDCDSDPNARIDLIETEISFKGDLTLEQIDRLKKISERCPVHRTLTSETKIVTTLV